MAEATPLASEQITQEDREAAATLVPLCFGASDLWKANVLAGYYDDGEVVQAFARHRIASLSASPAPSGQGGWNLRAAIDQITHDALPLSGVAMDIQGRARVQVYIADAVAKLIVAPSGQGVSGEVPGRGYVTRDQFQAFAAEMLAQVHKAGGDMLTALAAAAKAGVAAPAPSCAPGEVGCRCANCGGYNFRSVIAGDDGEAFCSVDCANQHGELGCPLETGSAYRAHIPSESERIMRAAINDIADAEPIPTPIDAFEWCVIVAQDAVNRIAALSPQRLDAKEGHPAQQLAEQVQREGYDTFAFRGSVQTEGEAEERFTVTVSLSTPSQRLDAATVERCAQVIRDWHPDEEAAGCGATWADCKYALLDAVASLATEPHQQEGGA